jgi:hypothetical protein
MQPKYYKLDIKKKARKKNIEIYRELTGNFSIPENKQYWTLCNLQPPDCDGTEIVQLRNMGFILSDSQFYGVDFNEEIIIKNREWHPNATWIYGDWEEGVRQVDNFNPSLVYLDMTSFVSTKKVLYSINSTMSRCKINTVILVNLMLNDPRSSRIFDSSFLVSSLPKTVPSLELSKWRQEVNSFTYNATGYTEMKTFVFFKERN